MTWANRPAPDAALGDRFGWQDCLGDLRITALLFTGPAGIGGPDQFADENRHRLVVEPFAGALADADLDLATAGTELLGVTEVDLLPATRKVLRLAATTVPLPIRYECHFSCRRFERRWDVRF